MPSEPGSAPRDRDSRRIAAPEARDFPFQPGRQFANCPDPSAESARFLATPPAFPLLALDRMSYKYPWNKWTIKIDHVINDNNKVSFLFGDAIHDGPTPGPDGFPGLPGVLVNSNSESDSSRNYRATYNRVFTPTVIYTAFGVINFIHCQIELRAFLCPALFFGTDLGLRQESSV